MARLTAAARREIKPSKFALHENGKDSYPIEDAGHARDALARIHEFGTPHEIAVVTAHVHGAYPGMKIKNTKK